MLQVNLSQMWWCIVSTYSYHFCSAWVLSSCPPSQVPSANVPSANIRYGIVTWSTQPIDNWRSDKNCIAETYNITSKCNLFSGFNSGSNNNGSRHRPSGDGSDLSGVQLVMFNKVSDEGQYTPIRPQNRVSVLYDCSSNTIPLPIHPPRKRISIFFQTCFIWIAPYSLHFYATLIDLVKNTFSKTYSLLITY